METFYLERSKSTPEILFRPEANIFFISGNSYPENAVGFYAPVFEWMNNYLTKSILDTITINFEFVYFNTTTSMEIIRILKLLKSFMYKVEVIINWHYNLQDVDLLHEGKRLEAIAKMKFIYIKSEFR